MASYSDKVIRLKTFLLMAYGCAPFEGDQIEHLVLEREPSQYPSRSSELDANGFDTGSLRSSFETHDAAREHLNSIQNGAIKINSFRKIKPDDIRIHEFVYEARAVDFDDHEHEIMSVIGALDSIPHSDRAVIKAAFPTLVDTEIEDPQLDSYQTHNGDIPITRFSAYVIATADLRQKFNQMAEALVRGEDIPITPGQSTAEFVNETINPRRSYFRRDLSSVAEEVGKAKLGLRDQGGGGTEVLHVRLYDYRNTQKPEPKSEMPSLRIRALKALSQQDPAVVGVLFDAMRFRGINPFAEKAGDRTNTRLPEPVAACK